MCLKGWTDSWQCSTRGKIIPTQEAPQRPNILRNFTERTVHTPVLPIDSNGLGRRWVDKLAQLDGELSQDTADGNGAGRVRKAVSPRWRKPTPLQTARWKAVRKAKRKGLSIRGIARELGIHRDTVKKYMNAESPPLSRAREVDGIVV